MATFNETASAQLRAMCDALDMREDFPEALLLQRFLFDRWGDREIPARPNYRSLISDDHSPYEYSVAFGKETNELRLLLEAQADKPTLKANQLSARALTERIASIFPVSTERLDAISDLFLPRQPQGLFSYWHAVVLGKKHKPEFKVYLNPQVQGKQLKEKLVLQALERLGMGSAARLLEEQLALRGPELDELKYFSLDLSDKPNARVKVYFCHHKISAAELERAFSAAPTHERGDIAEYCMQMVGHGGPFTNKSVSSCFSFVEGVDAPTSVTFHLPIAHYAQNDDLIRSRVATFMTHNGLDAHSYNQLLSRFSARPLVTGPGTQSYASFRRDAGGPRLTVYLSPELFQIEQLSDTVERPALRNRQQQQ